ncbi:MAG TPA: HAD family phosphatase [Rhodopseudomonas sp.]|uniref:HAD family hydrolase n=1 Tax=Rhodopseudomonas sp. TaxID=1078 RepID=UPI002EDAE1F1
MPVTLAPDTADALLFDLGRVVLEIDFDRALASWARDAGCAPAELRGRWVANDAYRRHERGEIDDAAFFAALRGLLGVALTDAQWLAGWNALLVGEMPGIAALLARAAKRLPLYAFSNTNPAHVAHFSQAHAALLGQFRRVFVSSTIGMRKPELAAYDHVIAEIGVPAQRIVFFDDLIENIDAARARGLLAVHVHSSADVARALDALGV